MNVLFDCSFVSSLLHIILINLPVSSRKRFSRKWKLKIVEKNIFCWKKSIGVLFSPLKIKMMDLWMEIEVRKLTFIVNFSVLDFLKFASRMPQTTQILVSTFKIFWGSMPLDPPRYFLFFSFSSSQDLGTKIPILNFETQWLSFACCW